LSAALAHFVRPVGDGRARRILEVGPGTGVVTRHIVAALGPADRLDLVELNDSFVEHLRQRFRTEPDFHRVSPRARVWHCPIERLPVDQTYDAIVSGLPLNNFAVEEVRGILEVLTRLAEPGGTLSFFEYVGIRRLKGLLAGRAERQRLRGIGRLESEFLAGRQIRRDCVWANCPPAWVHHVRF
jgi:phospholipid N-methyltransferase